MAIDVGNTIPSRDEGKGHVFGTFPDGSVYYDPTEFERKRSDGTTIIDLVPDCRVFVYGVELSKDVVNVSIQNSLGGNTCTIKLSSPNGKYEISKRDLIGKWREDKDILSSYGYDWLKRVQPDKPDILGLFMSSNTKSVIDSLTDPESKEWWDRTLGSAGWPSIFNATRMMFEIKHFSGITKRNGDIVFDYRDPVMVFMKGRFSPFWYFAFTGVVVSWDDTDTYDQEQSITLRCEDPLHFLKRTRFTKQGSLLNFGNLETMTRNVSKSQKTNIWQTIFGSMLDGQATTLDRAIKFILYGVDKGGNVTNCHPRFSSKVLYDQVTIDQYGMRDELSKDFKIGKPGGSGYVSYQDESDFMFTLTENKDYSQTGYQGFTGAEDAASRWTNLINVTDLTLLQNSSLNVEKPLSDALSLYLQFNGIEIKEFTGENLTKYYNESVRYWEVRPKILESAPSKEYSGWDDGKAIGIAGTHPALTYNFINYFEMLPHVWKDCWNRYATDRHVFDKLVLSPHEKIREIVSGSPTENATGASGNHENFFRPRVFVVLPKKFLDKNRSIVASGFGSLQLFNPEQARSYDCLKEICEAVEFNLFSSPAGDIFIEPEMYDFHPTEFVLTKDPSSASSKHNIKTVGQIEPRNIILKKEEVEFRTVNSEEYGEENQRRKDNAYFFNPDANHPFFLMEKDRIRCSQTFKPENVVTHVSVMGSPTGKGGVADSVFVGSPFAQQMAMLVGQSGNQESSLLAEKYYVADGFGSQIRRGLYLGKDSSALDLEIKKLKKDFNDSVYQKLVETHYNSNLLTLFEDAGDAATGLATSEYDVQDKPVDPNLVTLLQDIRFWIDQGQADADDILINKEPPVKSTITVVQTLYALAPKVIKYLQDYADLQQQGKAFKSKSKPVWSALMAVEPTSVVKYFFGSKEDANIASLNNLSTTFSDVAATDLDRAKIDVRRGLIKLYLPIALRDPDLRRQYEAILELEARKGNKTQAIDVMTLGDLKKLEQAGLYNPSTDMVRYYGYNPGPSITNLMIYNDSEALRYARTWFNKLFGRAHQIHMEIIGRPEMLLNRPYYCERKDSIGLLQNYSLNFAVDADFQTSLDLTYIRKNSLTYDYTLDELDELDGARTNKDFKNAAVAYYNSLADRVNLVQKGLSGIGRQAGRALGGEIGGEVGQQLLNYDGKGYSGALFTAHNWIGHMEFDRVGREDPVVSGAVKKSEITDPKQQIFIGKLDSKDSLGSAKLIKFMISIQTYLREISDLENKLSKLTEEINNDAEAQQIDSDLKSGVRQSNQTKLSAQAISKLATFDKLYEQHKYLCRHIYGYGEYTGGAGEEIRKPSKKELENTYAYYNNSNIDRSSLYYRFLDEIVKGLGIDMKKIKLLDDRVVGVDTVAGAYAIKTGYDQTLPLYMEPNNKDWTTIFEGS